MSTNEVDDEHDDEVDDEHDDEVDEDEDTDLNEEEREIVRKKLFEDKPEKTQEGRTIYDNIIRCLKSKMLTKADKYTEVKRILDNITDPEVLKMAVNRGLHSSPQVSPTPLFIAAEQGYDDIVALLLSKGADITESVELEWGKYRGKKNKYEYFVTPLFVAAMNGYEDIVKLLLEFLLVYLQISFSLLFLFLPYSSLYLLHLLHLLHLLLHSSLYLHFQHQQCSFNIYIYNYYLYIIFIKIK